MSILAHVVISLPLSRASSMVVPCTLQLARDSMSPWCVLLGLLNFEESFGDPTMLRGRRKHHLTVVMAIWEGRDTTDGSNFRRSEAKIQVCD